MAMQVAEKRDWQPPIPKIIFRMLHWSFHQTSFSKHGKRLRADAIKLQGVFSLVALKYTMTKKEAEVVSKKTIPFNDRDPRIDILSGIAQRSIWQNILDQKVPTRALMTSEVFYLNDEHERGQALNDLDESAKVLTETISRTYARDVWIVQNALKLSRNTAIVVGYSHVADLKSKCVSQCESEVPVP